MRHRNSNLEGSRVRWTSAVVVTTRNSGAPGSWWVATLGVACALFLILRPGRLEAQIGVYYTNSVSSSSGSATISSFTVPSVPAGDSYFIVGISCFASLNSSAPYCSGSTPLTWNSSTSGWTVIGGATTSNFRAVDMWYFRNPSGTSSLAVSTSASKLVVGVVLVGGVNTGGPSSAFGTFVETNGNSSSPAAPAATTVVGDLVVSAAGVYQTLCGSNSPPTGCTPTSPQAQQWELYSSTSSSNIAGLGSTVVASTTSTTMSWSASSSNNWSIGAIPIHAAAVTAPTRKGQTIVGQLRPPDRGGAGD